MTLPLGSMRQAVVIGGSSAREVDAPATVVSIDPNVVASVTLSPSAFAIIEGLDVQDITATPRNSSGGVVGGTATWTTSNAVVATVVSTGSLSGRVTAVADGTATITATVDGIGGTSTATILPAVATVTVTPNPMSINLSGSVSADAGVFDDQGGALPNRNINWLSDDPGIASVVAGAAYTATVTGNVVGSAVITATVEGVSGTSTATVTAGAFVTPDIINNLSWETGWDGWVNGSLNNPSPSSGNFYVIRSTNQSFNGSWSVRSHFTAGAQGASSFAKAFGNNPNAYFRFYFYATDFWNADRKWFRFQPGPSGPGGTSQCGLFNGSGKVPFWAFNNSSPGNIHNNFSALGVISSNVWHYWEINLDQTNGRVRFWLDGTVTVPSAAGNNTVSGDFLVAGGGAWPNQQVCQFDDNYNSGGTVTGDTYYDRFAVSTQRIGP